jgi:hypothetical protein
MDIEGGIMPEHRLDLTNTVRAMRLLLTVDVAYRRADDMPFMLSTVYGDYRAQSPCPLYYRSSTLYQIH